MPKGHLAGFTGSLVTTLVAQASIFVDLVLGDLSF
jgi:hypothetical protein